MFLKAVWLVVLVGTVRSCIYNNPVSTFFPDGGAQGAAVMRGDGIEGSIGFFQERIDDLLYIKVNIRGLPANSYHGLHVHQNGLITLSTNISEMCDSAGGHFNPCNTNHGNISSPYNARHVGDYGNVWADGNGTINATFYDKLSNLYGPLGIIGRTIVLHELKDDLGLGGNAASLTTGNSGARIACGIIGIYNN